jgi:phycoerythrin-associated linker protein
MTLQDFLDQCVGKWFSQRTSHTLPPQELEAGKADLWIEAIEPDDATVKAECDRVGIDPGTAIALRTRWDGQSGVAATKLTGTTLLIFGDGGQFTQTNGDGTSLTGTHSLGEDEALTIVATADEFKTEERIWFAGPNLRERTSTVSYESNGQQFASFCSEIRLGGAPAK